MSCKNCVCYVDGHSISGKTVSSGQGLCTMHNKDVSASGSCYSCITVDGNSFNSRYDIDNNIDVSVSKIASVKTPVRRGMRNWAIVCFILAGLYALMSFGMGTMLLGMTVGFIIVGVMLCVISKSPKQSPYLLGKQSGMQKSTFVIICITAAFCAFALFNLYGKIETSMSNSTNNSSNYAETKRVTSVANFKVTEYELFVGEDTELTLELKPNNLTSNDIVVEVSSSNILSVSNIKLTTSGAKTILTFLCKAVDKGNATLVVKSKAGNKTSNVINFKVVEAPIIAEISKFNPNFEIQEVGDICTITCPMKPNNLSKEDIVIENSDPSILNVKNINVSSESDRTILTFDVEGISEGKATIKIKGSDGKTESNTLYFTINEKDTSERVYVTPTGKKYHYSSACAGSNAIATTRNQAIRSGKEKCKKCG